jgi:hypothetical protein
MTAADVAGDKVERASVSSELAPAVGRLAEAALQAATTKLSHKADGWIRGIDELAAAEGPAGRAGYEGLKARLQGKNAVWAATKGAWQGASVRLRVVAVLVVVLVLVLAPVVLVLLLLGLLIAAIIAGIRAATR